MFLSLNLERGLLSDNDDFGDFAAFRSASPPQKRVNDDTFFTAFQSNTVMQLQQVNLRKSSVSGILQHKKTVVIMSKACLGLPKKSGIQKLDDFL